MSNLDTYLDMLNEKNGSDLHIKSGAPAMVRAGGVLIKITSGPLTKAQVEDMAKELLGAERWAQFQKEKEWDMAVQREKNGRYRVNLFYQRGLVGLVLRKVKTIVPTTESLMLPSFLNDIALSNSGIVVVSGPTSSGKSSTMAAMVDWINTQREAHIITIEDPIEYLHQDKKSSVNQREIGIDTVDFKSALRYCMRQDPNVIMIGEIRDKESLMAGLNAAETGHLVLSTLHTSDAAGIVPRMLDLFPEEHQDQIRMQLASVFTAGICQRLVPTISKNPPLVPAVEILIATAMVKKLIRENKLDKLYAVIETGGEFGMRTLNQSLLDLANQKMITADEALNQSLHPEALKMNLQGIFLDESKRILSD